MHTRHPLPYFTKLSNTQNQTILTETSSQALLGFYSIREL